MKHITESQRQASAEWRTRNDTATAMVEAKMRALSAKTGGQKRWAR